MEINIICRRGFGLQTTQFVVISRCCFAWDGYEMYKIFKRTCWAIVFLIKSIVFPCPRCRRCRGLLKVPIIDSLKTIMNLILRGDETFKIKTVDWQFSLVITQEKNWKIPLLCVGQGQVRLFKVSLQVRLFKVSVLRYRNTTVRGF